MHFYGLEKNRLRTTQALLKYNIIFIKMARSAGFEPAAHGFEVRCSIQLSYERKA